MNLRQNVGWLLLLDQNLHDLVNILKVGLHLDVFLGDCGGECHLFLLLLNSLLNNFLIHNLFLLAQNGELVGEMAPAKLFLRFQVVVVRLLGGLGRPPRRILHSLVALLDLAMLHLHLDD